MATTASPATCGSLRAVLQTETAAVYAKRPDLRRAEIRRMIAERGWTEEIEHEAACVVGAARHFGMVPEQRRFGFLFNVGDEMHEASFATDEESIAFNRGLAMMDGFPEQRSNRG